MTDKPEAACAPQMPVHASDCALHDGPAYTPGPCSCGADPTMTPERYGSEFPGGREVSEREDDLKRYKAHVQAVNRATDKDIEKVATSPFRALSYIKTEDDLRQLLADERAAAFRAGQESMKARASACVTEHYESLCQEHRLLLVNRATAIAALEIVDE